MSTPPSLFSNADFKSSIVLIILGDVFQVPVGDLFAAAIWPGLTLVAAYIIFILIVSYVKKIPFSIRHLS